MNHREISYRYAKALSRMETGKEQMLHNAATLEQLAALEKTFKPFRDFFFSPILDKEKKKDFLDQCFKGHLEPLLFKFLSFLIDRGHITLLSNIAECYKELAYQANGILEVDLETAVPLDEPTKLKLKNQLEQILKKSILFREKISPQMIGGIILSFNNKTLNYSIKDRITKLKLNVLSETLSHG